MLDKAFEVNEIIHLDFFQEGIAVTPSIIKAKALSRDIGSTAIKYNHWENVEKKGNIILFMQSLHELRPLQQKTDCLREAAKHLQPNGKIIIAEHLCDWKNFLIYGPGAFHFFGNRHWMRVIKQSALSLISTYTVTTFIKVYVLENNHE